MAVNHKQDYLTKSVNQNQDETRCQHGSDKQKNPEAIRKLQKAN